MTNQLPFSGMGYLLRGYQLITKPGLKRYVIIPFIINIILFSVLLGVGVHFINYFTNLLPHWLHWLAWVFDTIFVIATSVMLVYLFTIITNLIGAPFNSLLSEKVQLITTGHKPSEEDTLKDTLKDIPRTLNREWCKIKYYIPRAILLLILYFIPIINIAASILWFIFSCWMMAIEYLDYPMDNHKMTFKETKQYLRKHMSPSFGFGFIVTIVAMIPIVNFTVMPAAVAGATVMYLEHQD